MLCCTARVLQPRAARPKVECFAQATFGFRAQGFRVSSTKNDPGQSLQVRRSDSSIRILQDALSGFQGHDALTDQALGGAIGTRGTIRGYVHGP